jgi:hypothetical protein
MGPIGPMGPRGPIGLSNLAPYAYVWNNSQQCLDSSIASRLAFGSSISSPDFVNAQKRRIRIDKKGIYFVKYEVANVQPSDPDATSGFSYALFQSPNGTSHAEIPGTRATSYTYDGSGQYPPSFNNFVTKSALIELRYNSTYLSLRFVPQGRNLPPLSASTNSQTTRSNELQYSIIPEYADDEENVANATPSSVCVSGAAAQTPRADGCPEGAITIPELPNESVNVSLLIFRIDNLNFESLDQCECECPCPCEC